ncbi:amidase [Mesorhizobium sp. YC-39]|uniref:amidase n=1 Tax=unclassified Mesorhizobium TaxID=325217 RepID=UPI0021E7FE38|nr:MULTISPECIES: amidase [unclassified Mesorhizobium]MCV3210828.1 amidase [Mesorhizobium sp. YC-2]MCV3231062.1 amidase [Mesorhizobium sp. YC-39]
MSDLELCYLSATEALKRFRDHSLSPVELLQAQLSRIEETRSTVNAFSFVYAQEALEAARKAEARYMANTDGMLPLEGLALASKDENAIEGKITTFGSLIYKDYVATSTTPVVQRLMDAGAIVHGRTTTPEFSSEGFTYSRIWGVTRNPWNLDYTPGGSSGGSGAALASGMTTFATGSDIGGSIRIPASACGVVGYKPPYGRNPATPPFNLDFYNHPGPMARTVEDCLMMQNIMCGPHPNDIASLKPKLHVPVDRSGIKGWKIAYSLDLSYFELDEDVRRNTLKALEVFKSLGAEVTEVDLGWTKKSEKAASDYLQTIFGAWVAEYLDERAELLTQYSRTFAESSQVATPKDFLDSLYTAGEMYSTFGPLMERYNVFVCPTLALPAVGAEHDPLKGLTINGKPVDPRYGWIMTYPFNMLSRCPVLSVPSGHAASGVPTGIQIVGGSYCDQDVFRAGLAYEQALGGWFTRSTARPVIPSSR